MLGDFNRDGIDDLLCSSTRADGPGESRPDSGEASVVFGADPFPVELDLALGDGDVIVYAPLESDTMGVQPPVDLNGDGAHEIVVVTAVDHPTRIPSVWLISPIDSDGDSITNLPDNCPLIFNPAQTDSDMDLVGDACQGDYDGDGQADAVDCAPGNAQAGTPAMVTGLLLSGGSTTTLNWQPAAFADEYDVSRGSLSALDGSDYGACQNSRDSDPTDTSFVDDQVPGSSQGYFYLVRGRNLTCPAVGSYGNDSDGVQRLNGSPLDCP